MSRTTVKLAARDYNAAITSTQVNKQVQSNSNRNLVINGNMAISQRSGTTAYTSINNYTLDRWKIEHNGLDELAFEVTQSTTVPDAFKGGYSLKYQTKTVESAIAADEFLALVQFFEGQNLQRLCYGSTSAKTMTLSFWVRSSLTGTFGVGLYQYDGGDVIGGTYTINSADTWEYKTVSIVGNTGDAIANDNTSGFKVQWCLGMGGNYTGTANTTWTAYTDAKRWNGHTQSTLLTTDESTWYITGVQLELGEKATEFEHETFDTTLIKCQRYYQIIGRDFSDTTPTTAFGWGYTTSSSAAQGMIRFERRMRAKPAFTQSTDQNLDIKTNTGAGAVHASNAFTSIVTSETSAEFTQQNHAGTFGGAGQPYFLKWNGVQGTGLAANIQLDAEL